MIRKYPRTPHLEGSRLQPGDEDLDVVPFFQVQGLPLVIEEKVDGANSALSFDDTGALLLQSRGHYLRGGAREKHFAMFKTWANRHAEALRSRLASRYVMYGEWLYARHTVYYDALPHWFLEYDVFDREREVFLSTAARRELLEGLPVVPVAVLSSGRFERLQDISSLVGRSLYKSTAWYARMLQTAKECGVDPERVGSETDPSDLAEGVYVKHEEGGVVRARYKWVRASFLTAVLDSGSHWLARPIVPNRLAEGVDVFAEGPGET